MNTNETRIGIPVPWVYAIGFLVGFGIQFIIPVTAGSETLTILRITGVLLVAVGATLMVWPHKNYNNIRELGALSI